MARLCSVPLRLLRSESALKLLLLLLLGTTHQIIERVHALRPLRLVSLHAHSSHVPLHLHAHTTHAHVHLVHLIHLTCHRLECHGLETSLVLLLLLGGLLVLLIHEGTERILSWQILLCCKWIALSSRLLCWLRILLLRVELVQHIQAIVRLELCCRLCRRCL